MLGYLGSLDSARCRRARVFVAALMALGLALGCGPKQAPQSAPEVGSSAPGCARPLPPRSAAPSVAAFPGPPPAPFVVPPSQLVVNAELSLRNLEKELEPQVPKRVAEARGQDIGAAGSLNYSVDRDGFRASVEGEALRVTTLLHGHAEACAKGRCYASCDPEIQVTARVPLRLSPDYRFARPSVQADFVRGCSVRVLGGLLRVDVTPTLRAQIAPALRSVEDNLQKRLPDLRPQAERLFAELGKDHPLPLGLCLQTRPSAVAQGPVAPSAEIVPLRFSVTLTAELSRRCVEGPKAPSLPPLAQEPAMPRDANVLLGVVHDGGMLGATMAPSPSGRSIAGANVTDAGSIDLNLAGDLCGPIAFRGRLGPAPDNQNVLFDALALSTDDARRVAQAGADPVALTKDLEGRVLLPVSVRPDDLRAALPALAAAASDDRFALSANVVAASLHSAGLRGPQLVSVARLNGSITVKQKCPSCAP